MHIPDQLVSDEVEMAKQWYFAQDGRKRGPVTSELLRTLASSGILLRNDLVRSEEMTKWVPASKVSGLFPSEASTASPLPERHATSPNSEPASQNPNIKHSTDTEITSKSKGSHTSIASALKEKQGIRYSAFKSTDQICVGLAIFFFFPLGIFLLLKNKSLKNNKMWWGVGCCWGVLLILSAIFGDKGKTGENRSRLNERQLPIAGNSSLPKQIEVHLANGCDVIYVADFFTLPVFTGKGEEEQVSAYLVFKNNELHRVIEILTKNSETTVNELKARENKISHTDSENEGVHMSVDRKRTWKSWHWGSATTTQPDPSKHTVQIELRQVLQAVSLKDQTVRPLAEDMTIYHQIAIGPIPSESSKVECSDISIMKQSSYGINGKRSEEKRSVEIIRIR